MAAFYNQGDQNIYKDFQYVPQEKYRLGFTAPTTTPIAAPVPGGITNTNAFNNSGNDFNPAGNAFGYGSPVSEVNVRTFNPQSNDPTGSVASAQEAYNQLGDIKDKSIYSNYADINNQIMDNRQNYQANYKSPYEDSIDQGKVAEEKGHFASRNSLQTTTLLETISNLKLDACMGGARRDEEKARAKERVFSVRDDFGQWNEKLQRPELFDHLNGAIHPGENIRAFPISNWTELDVWEYIRQEKLEIPTIYYAHKRAVFKREGQFMPVTKFHQIDPDQIEVQSVRFRTVGDMSCTAAVLKKLGPQLTLKGVQEWMINAQKEQWKNEKK